jgi:hypothetical protein
LLGIRVTAAELKVACGAAPRDDQEVAMLTRSMLEVLLDMASYIDVTAVHVAEHRAAPGFADMGGAASGLKPLSRVYNSVEKPSDPFVTTRYRDHWFWIDDRDLTSKGVFSFLMFLFTLPESGSGQVSPVLTVLAGWPAGVATDCERSKEMLKPSALLLAIAAAYVAGSANAAVVYCTAPGIPAGCVVRPAAPVAAAAAKVAYCTAPGVPVGCVAKPAAAAATAKAIYCTAPGVPAGCVARPATAAATAAAVTPGVGAPGRGAVDPGINQPGALGNRGGGAPGVGVVDPGVNQPGATGNRGGGAPGAGKVDPGVNQPGAIGNRPGRR